MRKLYLLGLVLALALCAAGCRPTATVQTVGVPVVTVTQSITTETAATAYSGVVVAEYIHTNGYGGFDTLDIYFQNGLTVQNIHNCWLLAIGSNYTIYVQDSNIVDAVWNFAAVQ